MYEEIQEQFNKVIKYSQPIDNPQTDKLFADWQKNKSFFITMFGDKLVYELPETIAFSLDNKAKQNRLDSFLSLLLETGLTDLYRFVADNSEGFFDNRVLEDIVLANKTKIPKNMKMVKAFKYFISDEKLLVEIQNKASTIIQENAVEGKLCFSVHPLDYLSASETTHNWRSCHSLDGAYRAGNLSYMTDSSTIICYLKSKEDTKLPNFPEEVPWNSKKWRVWLHFDTKPNIVFAGRQYPFNTMTGLEYINKYLLNDLINPARKDYAKWTDWTNNYYTMQTFPNKVLTSFNEPYIPMNDGIVKISSIVKDYADATLHYNDVLRSPYYHKPWYSGCYLEGLSKIYLPNINTQVNVGHPVKCLCCGEDDILLSAGTMMCYDCEYQYGTEANDMFDFCGNCNRRFVVEEGTYSYIDYVGYCSDCADECLVYCDRCGEPNEMNKVLVDEDGLYICSECVKNYGL